MANVQIQIRGLISKDIKTLRKMLISSKVLFRTAEKKNVLLKMYKLKDSIEKLVS